MSFIFMEIKNYSVHTFLKQGLGNSEMAYRKIPKISPFKYKPPKRKRKNPSIKSPLQI